MLIVERLMKLSLQSNMKCATLPQKKVAQWDTGAFRHCVFLEFEGESRFGATLPQKKRPSETLVRSDIVFF